MIKRQGFKIINLLRNRREVNYINKFKLQDMTVRMRFGFM